MPACEADGTAQAGTRGNKTCLSCHPTATYPTGIIHHVSKNNYFANGNCTQFHTDPRPTTAGMAHAPYQMSRGACHVAVNGDTVEVSNNHPRCFRINGHREEALIEAVNEHMRDEGI